MSRGMPWFSDAAGDARFAEGRMATAGGMPSDAGRQGRHDHPAFFEPLPEAPDATDTGWNPDRIQGTRSRRGASVLAVTGVAVLLGGWLLVSLIGSIVEAYRASPALGSLAFSLYAVGMSLIALAGLSEWRAWRSLRQVDDLRAKLSQPAARLADVKTTLAAWLETVPDQVCPAGGLIAAIRGADTHERIAALIRDSLAEPLRQEIARVARRSAVTGGMLVALSPHAAWDGMIIAVWSLKIIRRIAELHGLRRGPLVTLLLFRRIARTAVEIAAVDLVAQNVAAKLLEHTPLLRHVAAAIPGMGAAELRLYRFAILAGRACSPFET